VPDDPPAAGPDRALDPPPDPGPPAAPPLPAVPLPAVPLLAAQLNYDNLVLPITSLLLLLSVEFIQKLHRSVHISVLRPGAILLATDVENPPQRSLGVLPMTVERNAYGRQIDSAILESQTELPGGPLEMVFIRAPRIRSTGPEVETLASRDGSPTLVRYGHLMAATFHPELSGDTRVHQFFLETVRRHKQAQATRDSA